MADKIEWDKYLAKHVIICMDYHSTEDWNSFSGPMVFGTEGKGGQVFVQIIWFTGKYRALNNIQFNFKNWSNDEIFRAIASGVSRDRKGIVFNKAAP